MEYTELDLLIVAKNALSNKLIDYQTVEYENIVFNIDCAIHRRCEHNIINDTIDIDVEKTQNVCYCDKCYLTFTITFFRDYLLCSLNQDKRDQWKIITNDGVFDLIDIYCQNDMLYFQTWCSGWTHIIKFSLKDILNCNADDSIVYINN